jgi:hypothetical protein
MTFLALLLRRQNKPSHTIAATRRTPNGTPNPIPIFSAEESPWLLDEADATAADDVVAAATSADPVDEVPIAVGVVVDDADVVLAKLYEVGDGSS